MAGRFASRRFFRITALLALLALVSSGAMREAIAQQSKLRSCERSMLAPHRISPVEPDAELDRKVAEGSSFIMRFRRTKLDAKAEAIAQVAVSGQTLLVRVCAVDLPLPARWKEQRYSLWVYLPNYGQKTYIGDLPVIPAAKQSERQKEGHIARGDADTIFRFAALPRGSLFGGLILTAEPARYGPIVNEPLRPLLIALMSEGAVEDAAAQ